MDDMELKLTKLESLVAAGFAEIRTALVHSEDRQDERHAENSERLDKINGRVNDAHTKVDRLASGFDALACEVDRVRQNYHNLRNWIAGGKVQEQAMSPFVKEGTGLRGPGNEQPVTRSELKLIIGLIVSCLVGGAGVAIWILKLVGKL
jgi:hypothetical protein